MAFSIKDFFSKSDQIRSFLRIWSRLLKKSFMENFIFCAVNVRQSECWTHPPTCANLVQTVGRFNMWVTPKTNRPSFCLTLKLSQALDGLFCALGCMVVNISALFAEGRLTERDVISFRYCCLGFFLAWHPLLFIFR